MWALSGDPKTRAEVIVRSRGNGWEGKANQKGTTDFHCIKRKLACSLRPELPLCFYPTISQPWCSRRSGPDNLCLGTLLCSVKSSATSMASTHTASVSLALPPQILCIIDVVVFPASTHERLSNRSRLGDQKCLQALPNIPPGQNCLCLRVTDLNPHRSPSGDHNDSLAVFYSQGWSHHCLSKNKGVLPSLSREKFEVPEPRPGVIPI